MKRIAALFLSLCLLLSLGACGKKEPAVLWQEQFDLGIRYLNEGNYEEAIIAFEAAIEIDPKRPAAYSALANTYLAMGDYEKAATVWDAVPTDTATSSTDFSIWRDKTEDIRTALENGESGVWIVDCSFDRQSFIEGKETTFRLTAFYSCPESGEYHGQLYANINEPHSLSGIGYAEEVPNGRGMLQLSGTVAPVFWDGPYFRLMLLLRTEGVNSSVSDSIYLTPEGAFSDHYAPRNAYGGTEFIYRRKYQTFDTLETGLQERITAIARAAINGDREQLLSLVEAPGFDESLYTIWNGYKLEVYDREGWRYSDNDVDAATDKYKSFMIQLRPENGIGYYCSVHISETEDTTGKDNWLDYSRTVEVITCPCVDWQWNGAVSVEEYNNYLYRSADNTTCHTAREISVRGTMAGSLWEGSAVETIREVDDWYFYWGESKYSDETKSAAYLYENGILLEINGEPWTGGKGYHLIDSYDTGGRMASGAFWDERFW